MSIFKKWKMVYSINNAYPATAATFTPLPIESVDGWHMLSIVLLNAIQDETNSILRDSQMAIGFFALILVICSVFIFLVWRT